MLHPHRRNGDRRARARRGRHLPPEGVTQVLVGQGVIRIEADGGAVLLDRFVELAPTKEIDALDAVCLGRSGVENQGFLDEAPCELELRSSGEVLALPAGLLGRGRGLGLGRFLGQFEADDPAVERLGVVSGQ